MADPRNPFGLITSVPNLNLAQRQLVQNQTSAFMEANKNVYGRKPAYQLDKIRQDTSNRIAKELFGNQQQAAPAAAAAAAPAPNPAAQQLAELTAQSQAYRKEAEAAIEAGKLQISQLQDQELQRQKAAELQNRLAIQAQTSQARGAAQANLKIAPASQTAQTAGTQAFKRRRDQMRLAPIQSTAGVNVPANSVLNV